MEAQPAPAACKKCGKTYRIVDPHKSYMCKSCGGSVRAFDAPSEETEPASKEARRARGFLRSGRVIYLVCAFLLGLRAFGLRSGQHLLGLHVDLGTLSETTLNGALAFFVVATFLALAAARASRRSPLFFTLLMALIMTCASLLTLYLDSVDPLFFGLTAISWARLKSAFRVQELLRREPQLFGSRPHPKKRKVRPQAELLS